MSNKKKNNNNNGSSQEQNNKTQQKRTGVSKNELREASANIVSKMPDVNYKPGATYQEAAFVVNLFDLIYGDAHIEQNARGDFDSYYIKDKTVFVDKDLVLKMICLSPEFGISFVKALFTITEDLAFAKMVGQIRAGEAITANEVNYSIPLGVFYSVSDTVRRLTEKQLTEQYPQRGVLGYSNLVNLYHLMSTVAKKEVDVAALAVSYKENYRKIRLAIFKDIFRNDIPKNVFTKPSEVKEREVVPFFEQYVAPTDLTYEMGLIFGVKDEATKESEQKPDAE